MILYFLMGYGRFMTGKMIYEEVWSQPKKKGHTKAFVS